MRDKNENTNLPIKRKRTVKNVRTESVLLLPSGAKFNDIYMDSSQVAQELNYGKRAVRNIRLRGALSYTTLTGKLFYYRQEIAAILQANKVPKKK
jgi:hypothetical protein